MNLVHHLLVAEKVRERLAWPENLRGQMLLAAIAPDAHTEAPGLGRAILHPAEDLVAAVLELTGPCGAAGARLRAFAVSIIAHLVADEITRPHPYHLPPHAPTGFQPAPDAASDRPDLIDIEALRRALIAEPSEYSLGPLPAAGIDRKRWEVLGRWPLTEGTGPFVIVEPLLTVVAECADTALLRIRMSDAAELLLGD